MYITLQTHFTSLSNCKGTNPAKITWDSRTSPEDMEEMWNNANVSKEWNKSGEKRGKVRLSHDTEKRPYLSRTEQRVRMYIFAPFMHR